VQRDHLLSFCTYTILRLELFERHDVSAHIHHFCNTRRLCYERHAVIDIVLSLLLQSLSTHRHACQMDLLRWVITLPCVSGGCMALPISWTNQLVGSHKYSIPGMGHLHESAAPEIQKQEKWVRMRLIVTY
jgi:hypothetical protein